MASGTLYTYPKNFRAFKAQIAAEYSGYKLDVAPDFVFGQTNRSTEFLKKFPVGKVPAFESSDGYRLHESNAIAYYVSNELLRGTSLQAQSKILQWISFCDNEILPAVCAWVYPCLGLLNANKQAMERGQHDTKLALAILDETLIDKSYLVGDTVSLADISVACNLLSLFEHVLDEPARRNIPNLTKWFTSLVNQPQFTKIIGEFKLCEKAAQPGGGGGGGAKKEKPKTEKKKEEKAPNESKPKAPANDDGDGDDLGIPLEPKAKDPFEAFPKGTFVMDDFKRFYSNNPEDKAINYFWEKFDKENYSMWYCEYKYADELTMVFMSCNLMSGMMQRLDKMRKHAFGSLLLFGEDNSSTISGVWIWRGHDLAFELSPDTQVDYESYDWKKLDPNTDETKKLLKAYWGDWDKEDFGEKKFNQGKIFK